MKNLKFLTALLFISVLSLTSCQDEIDTENGEDPDTNTASSVTASNLERSSMHDGSFDDFLDGMSCSSVLLPVTATVNNTQVTIVSQSDYDLVLDIMGQFTDDDDSVQFQFPLTVRLSNYTEIVVANQSDFDALNDACEEAEQEAEDAISCLDVDFPVTILTYNIDAEQTGSVVLESEQQLFSYMNNFDDSALFSVSYPITATLNNDTVVEISSDADLQAQINSCLETEDAMEDAQESATIFTNILVDGLYTVESLIISGVETADDLAEYTIDFANDFSVTAENVVNTTAEDVEGTFEVASELEIFLTLTFSGNANVELLNSYWEVTSYSESSVSLQNTTNAAITLVLSQI